jgi:hypothetical protein
MKRPGAALNRDNPRKPDEMHIARISEAPKKKPAIDTDAGFPCLLAPQLIGMDFVSE